MSGTSFYTSFHLFVFQFLHIPYSETHFLLISIINIRAVSKLINNKITMNLEEQKLNTNQATPIPAEALKFSFVEIIAEKKVTVQLVSRHNNLYVKKIFPPGSTRLYERE